MRYARRRKVQLAKPGGYMKGNATLVARKLWNGFKLLTLVLIVGIFVQTLINPSKVEIDSRLFTLFLLASAPWPEFGENESKLTKPEPRNKNGNDDEQYFG
jgi:hypothetical protein